MTQIGYFGVIIPQHDYYQGYFLDDGVEPDAQGFLDRIRSSPGTQAMLQQVTSPRAFDLDPAANQLIGAASATLVDTALSSDHTRTGVLGYAIYLLTKINYFTVTTRPNPIAPSLVYTEVQTLPVTSIPAARKAIENDPDVLAMKPRLLNQLWSHMTNPRKH
jgi:hypothetical protein